MPRSIRRFALSVCAAVFLCAALPVFAQQSTHVVQPGENLFRIAQRYGLTTAELAAANNIANTWQIYSGQVLTIPVPGVAAQPAFNPNAPAIDPSLGVVIDPNAPAFDPNAPAFDPNAPAIEPAPQVSSAPSSVTAYTVQPGDTLNSIATRFGMTTDQLAQLNNITNPNLIFRGQSLNVYSSAPPAVVADAAAAPAAVPAPTSSTTHVVQPGEYLSSIARRYGVSWLAIAQANNIYDPNTVFTGQTLTIPAPGSTPYIADAGIIPVAAGPAPVYGSGREIIVDLSDSRVYAYENGVLVRNVLGSMGRAVTPTVQGQFRVQRKYVATPMSGPGYYLPDVPYTMYFYSGYAIHGTYWHSNWGVPMSHGCVNLPTPEAEWFFNFADIGTPVTVQA